MKYDGNNIYVFSPTGEEHDGIVCKIKNPVLLLDLKTFQVVVEMDLQKNERAVKIYTSD